MYVPSLYKNKTHKANAKQVLEACIQYYCLHGIHVRQALCLLILFTIYQLGPFELLKTLLKSLHVLLGLFPVLIHYQKGSQKQGAA